MAQPKTPPLSIRLGDATLEGVDRFAEANSLSRHAAVVKLVTMALGGWTGLETVKKLHDREATKSAAIPPTVSRAPSGVLASVPVLQRKPFNPQPKTGKVKR